MIEARDIIAIILFLGVLLAYIFALIYQSPTSKDLAQLLTIVVVAIVSYYLGYSRRIISNIKITSSPTSRHLTRSYIMRLGYIAIGFGIALILQHVVCYGINLEPSELLLGHEWIGLYALVAGMLMIGWAKKIQV